MGHVPRFALVLGIASLGCSLSIAAFFVGVPLGLLSVLLALGAMHAGASARFRRTALRALVTGALGLSTGLGVWFLHVRAAQIAYRVPSHDEVVADFERNLKAAAPPRSAAPASASDKEAR